MPSKHRKAQICKMLNDVWQRWNCNEGLIQSPFRKLMSKIFVLKIRYCVLVEFSFYMFLFREIYYMFSLIYLIFLLKSDVLLFLFLHWQNIALPVARTFVLLFILLLCLSCYVLHLFPSLTQTPFYLEYSTFVLAQTLINNRRGKYLNTSLLWEIPFT